MRSIKGVYLSVLVASVVAIFGLLPQAAQAIPPASLRIWFLLQQTDMIKGVLTYFHNPADTQLFNQLTHGQAPENLGIRIYDTTSRTVNSGQSVAVTSVVWLDEEGGTPFPVTGTQPDAHKLFQTIPRNAFTGAVWSSRLTSDSEYYTETFAPPIEEVNNYLITGPEVVASSGRPHIIESIVYTAPDVASATGEVFSAQARYSYSANTAETASLLGPEALLRVVSNQQKVEVTGGTAAVDRLELNSNRLIPTDQGQTVITSSDTVPCGWVVNEIRGDCITGNPTTIGVYAGAQTTRENSWLILTRTMSKLAQERGEFTNATGSALSTKIKDFIATPLDIWESSRGKVLFVTTSGDITIDPGTMIELKGKKVIVFTNADTVRWPQNVVVVDGGNTNSPHHKLAVIAFKDDAVIELTGDAYVGAYISRGRVHLAGSGSTLNVRGLVIADDELTVTRSVSGTTTVIARITYDPSFQNGTVVGLSPFVRPLVSGGTDR